MSKNIGKLYEKSNYWGDSSIESIPTDIIDEAKKEFLLGGDKDTKTVLDWFTKWFGVKDD